ncbi:MAG: radical SAM protein [Pontiellaceae bacterium]|jgi:radical SAM protein with 4Fe4S-binding SPASM domain|nr:radical SAM protein [Pontiellaceae bacterium]
MNYRFEDFGGIISSTNPPFLAFVDRDYMRSLSLESPEHWPGEQKPVGILSAPTEVHFAATNQCSAGCANCYMDSGRKRANELNTDEFKKAIDLLAGMGVFHIALGGGEALLREDFFELAEYARKKGLVPNLTISGISLNPAHIEKMTVLGQVNLSLDGIGEAYGVYRGKNHFDSVNHSFDLIRQQGIPVGINCVIGAANFDLLESIFAYAAEKKVTDIDFLRYKPSGRGTASYHRCKLSNEQNMELIPRIKALSEKYQVASKADCSFIPMICWHRPPFDEIYGMGTYGCEAGNVLLGITSEGQVSGCSFLPDSGLTVFDLQNPSARTAAFSTFLHWTDHAPMPCRECAYLEICKGGCHAVANFVTGSFDHPDPECPAVVKYNRTGAAS